jgi:hypothetical protein
MRNNRRFSEIMLGLFLLFLGASALVEGGQPIMTLLVLGGIFMLVRQFESGRSISFDTPPLTNQRAGEPRVESSTKQRIYHHALSAVEAAGLDPETVKVLTTDIGIMAFKEDQDPVVYRTRDVLDDIDYIQPYVQLRLPTKAVGLIRFEIIDADGEVLFIHEERHQLERGRNLISPAARLPIHDAQAMDGEWELRVSADGVPLALHHFGWQESTTKVVRRHLSEDGEISSELRAALADSRLQGLSLDELLAEQEDQAPARQQRR